MKFFVIVILDVFEIHGGKKKFFGNLNFPPKKISQFKDDYSPFCVPAKVTKLIGLKRPPFLSPTNLIIFACTQNGE
jgi:hypothetical protein